MRNRECRLIVVGLYAAMDSIGCEGCVGGGVSSPDSDSRVLCGRTRIDECLITARMALAYQSNAWKECYHGCKEVRDLMSSACEQVGGSRARGGKWPLRTNPLLWMQVQFILFFLSLLILL